MMEELIKFCREHGLSFDLHYNESSDSWDLFLHGTAKGEAFFVKNIGTLEDAIKYAIGDAKEFYGR